MSEGKVHYVKKWGSDELQCGGDAWLLSGTTMIENVTCLRCLQSIVIETREQRDKGEQAAARIAAIKAW